MLDIERLVSDYLRTDSGVLATSGVRVVGKTPEDTDKPWVRVTLLNATSHPQRTDLEHLLPYLVQLDCYSTRTGGQPQANTLAIAVRHALAIMSQEPLDGAVVTAVSFAGHLRLPDEAFTPARERVVISAEVHAHP